MRYRRRPLLRAGFAAILAATLLAVPGNPAVHAQRQGKPGNTPPTVTLTAPASGLTAAAPATVVVSADVTDVDGKITHVKFFAGSKNIGTVSKRPYSLTWKNVPPGRYTLTAEAGDTGGGRAKSAPVTITVTASSLPPALPPTVSLTSPADQSTFAAPASISLSANAADDGVVTQVAFYAASPAGTVQLAVDTSAPFSYIWPAVPQGTYSLTAVATDDAGLTTTSAAASVTVDTPPTVALTAPAPASLFVAPAALTLAADATDSDGTVVSVAFYNGVALLGTDTTAPFSFDWINVSSGTYSLTAVATDNHDVSTTSAPIAVEVDNRPAVALTFPAPGSVLVAPATLSLAADATDSDGTVVSVAFFSGATLLGTDTTAPFSFDWNNVAAGSYQLTAVATDDDDVSTTSAPIALDVDTPPIVTLTSPAAGTTFTGPATISITADATDSDGTVASVAFYNGPTLLGTDTTAPFSFDWNNVPSGTYSLTAVATDNHDVSTTSAAVTVDVDTSPLITLTAPADGTVLTAPASTAVTATVSDDGGVTQVAFYVESTLGRFLIGIDTGAPYSVDWNNVPGGTYSVTAEASDAAGHTTVSAAATVIVDNRPVIAISSVTSGTYLSAPAAVTIFVAGGDVDDDLDHIAVFDGATLLASLDAPPFIFDLTLDTVGTHTLTAVATDAHGLTGTSAPVDIIVTPAPPADAPLVQPTSFTYQGAFRVPDGLLGSIVVGGDNVARFDYGGTTPTFYPERNSLFLTGHDWGQGVAEISIPAPQNGPVGGLVRATALQPFADPLHGLRQAVQPCVTVDGQTYCDTIKIGGMLTSGNRLYVSAFDYFDALGSQQLSHFISSPDLNVADVQGPFQVGASGFCGRDKCAGFVSGYFGRIPYEWQGALGGPVLNGNCCLAIISRSSYGPSASAIDPRYLGALLPLPAVPLVQYPATHKLAAWDSTNALFNGSTQVTGVVFPDGWRSVLFFGRHGLGQFCYGPGTSDPALAGTPADGGTDIWCYDPTDSSKGTHAYPYAYYVWAYDALDLADVKSGLKQPWEASPYGVWQLPLPADPANPVRLGGATYDPSTGRVFLSQMYGDGTLPVIHVFTLEH